jgi:hypothetical protein
MAARLLLTAEMKQKTSHAVKLVRVDAEVTGAFHFLGFSFVILILILHLIRTEEGEEIKIKIRSKIKRGTQECEMQPPR